MEICRFIAYIWQSLLVVFGYAGRPKNAAMTCTACQVHLCARQGETDQMPILCQLVHAGPKALPVLGNLLDLAGGF